MIPSQQQGYLPKLKLFETWISKAPYKSILAEIIKLAGARQSSYVCFANVHMLTEARKSSEFNTVVNNANIAAPDGKPLSILMQLQYKVKQERACGMDMLPDILKEAELKKLSVFFYGSTQDVLDLIAQKLEKEFPALKLAGIYSPPFRILTNEEDQAVIKMINNSGAHLVFVSLGCPKQEKWMHAHQGKINACMLGVGQAFLTYTGLEKRLPKWTRDLSLEWLYRFYLEPKRLWKRYLVGNSMFLGMAVISLIKYKFSKNNV